MPQITASKREALIAIASAGAIDAVVAAILLRAIWIPSPLAGPAAACLHGAAIMLLLGVHGARPGRRWLCIAAVSAIPVAGEAIAAATLATRGRGSFSMWRRGLARGRRAPTTGLPARVGSCLSLCDALGPGHDVERRAALFELSRRNDPEAIAVLRWAIAGPDPDLALSAALVLDKLHERAERRATWLNPAESRRAAR